MTEKTGTIILIGGEKGGTGKSTIATNLAVFLAGEGVDTMLLDADPQATASKWVERRNNANEALLKADPKAKVVPEVHCTQKHGDILKTALDLSKRYQVVLIDAGGRDSKELRTGMAIADRMYIPIRASQADLETLPKINELVSQIKATVNPSFEAYAILSMAPSNPMINEVQEAQELLSESSDIGLGKNIIRDRKVYRDAMISGKGVVEMSNSTAKAEIQLLAEEIFQ